MLEEAADRFQLGAPHLPLLGPAWPPWTASRKSPGTRPGLLDGDAALSLRQPVCGLSAGGHRGAFRLGPLAPGLYTDGGASASPAASSGAARSEEELQASVAAYAAEVFPKAAAFSLSAGEDGEVPSPYFGPCRRFTLELEDGTSLQLTAAKQDGSLCAMTVLQTP